MLERLLLAAGLLALVTLALLAARGWLRLRRSATVRRLRARPLPAPGGAAGRILYFSTPQCVQCRQLQEPALERLVAAAGDRLVVEKVNAVERDDLARQYRILTVPSTAVFGPDGRLVEINEGYAPAERLAAQLGLPASALPPAPRYSI